MSSPLANRQLLFGLLALKNDFVDSRQLLRAFDAWAADKSRPLAEALAADGVLDPGDAATVERLVERFLQRHGGDVEASLAAVNVATPLREKLAAGVADPDVQASLLYVPAAADGDGYSTLQPPAVGAAPGSRYQILRLHARGGLGEVFEAEDAELRRVVALKQIKPQQADNQDNRARFVREAEITGGLEHPGIVPVYGLGQNADGRPYYAMRLVKGQSLQEALRRFHQSEAGAEVWRSLAFRKLLGQLVSVCHAMQYAHDRGVLHRDLKPANIMLGKYGETLVVDWGLAKARGEKIEPQSTDESLLIPFSGSGTAPTVMGRALGTPQFMSPEQARGEVERLDQRSDVYSLGAILYVMLTGRPPVDDDDLGVTLRRVQAGDFPRPRQVRPTTPRALEAVCLRAMERLPDDRYDTARALAADVERWLADEPVTAYPEPLQARMRRWGRRHQALTAGALAVLLTVAGALSVGLAALGRKQTEVIAERNAAREARDDAEAVNRFYENEVLAAARPEGWEGGRGKDVTLQSALDTATPKIEQAFAGRPKLEATLLSTLGATYYFLGEFDAAHRQLERAYQLSIETFGPLHPHTLKTATDLALTRWKVGDLKGAESLCRLAFDGQTKVLGPNHEDTLHSHVNLGMLLINTGRLDEAEAVLQSGVDACHRSLGADHRYTLYGQHDLAITFRRQGRPQEALALIRQAADGRRRSLGPDHPDTLRSVNTLGFVLGILGYYEEAEMLCRQALEGRLRVLGDDHMETYWNRDSLGEVLGWQGKYDEAVAFGRQVVSWYRDTMGSDHPDTYRVMQPLAASLHSAGKEEEAEQLCREALDAQRRLLGVDHNETLETSCLMAYMLAARGEIEEAEKLYRQTLAAQLKVRAEDNFLVAPTLAGLGEVLSRSDRAAEAEPMLRQSLKKQEAVLAPGHWRVADVRSVLGECLAKQRKFAVAEPLLIDAYKQLADAVGTPPRRLAKAQERIVELYERWEKPDEAERWRRQGESRRERRG